jgi:cold shock CspA family protein/ribosome-associated translation inhibitor RaiA
MATHRGLGGNEGKRIIMQRPLQITSRDFVLTDPMRAMIEKRAEALEQYFGRLTGCHVVIEAPVHHHRRGGPFNVRIDSVHQGQSLSVNKQGTDDLAVAIREAFDSARRRLEDHLHELRGDVKTHTLSSVGFVARIFMSEGYGFLETADNREFYFHRNAVLDGHFDDLKPGTTVRFVEEQGEKGPQASTVAMVVGKLQG